MAHDQQFRFLDLPKELRLMVYDCLPTKITHHKISTAFYAYVEFPIRYLGIYIEAALRARLHCGDWPVHSVKIVRKTMSGLAILTACHQIASEAGAILHPKLRAISEGPAQIITNSVGLESSQLACMIGRFSLASSGKEVKHLLDIQEEKPGDDEGLPPGTTFRPVQVAIRNNFLNRDMADEQTRMQVLGDEIFPLVHKGWAHNFVDTHFFVDPPPEVSLYGHLRFRMACLTAQEKEAYDKVQPLALTKITNTLTIDSAEVIETMEWEDNWAEGVGY
jgi:hypothetical protein